MRSIIVTLLRFTMRGSPRDTGASPFADKSKDTFERRRYDLI